MFFQEPLIEFVELSTNDINTVSYGPGYTVCQRVFTSDVGCDDWGGNVTAAELCEEARCDNSSNAANSQAFNSF